MTPSPDPASAPARRQMNARIEGQGARALVFAHGFGCDQTVWHRVAPAFADEARVVLFDHAGCGAADPALYDRQRHSRLEGYAEDVIRLLDDLDPGPVDFIAHSVSSTIGILAAIARPELFASLVMIGPSVCYMNDGGYRGGFDRAEIEGLLEFMDSNFTGWASSFAAAATGPRNGEAAAADFARTLGRNDPEIASAFARATMLADYRDLPALVTTPAHILQSREDVMATEAAVAFVHAHLPGSRLWQVAATGHCPHITHPAVLGALLRQVLAMDAAPANRSGGNGAA